MKSQLEVDTPTNKDSIKWSQDKPKELKLLYDKYVEQQRVKIKPVKSKRISRPKHLKNKQM